MHFRRVDLPEGGTACQLCSGNTGRVFIERSQQVVCLGCGRDIAQAMSAFDPPPPPESEKDQILRGVGTYLDAHPEFSASLADFIEGYERRRNINAVSDLVRGTRFRQFRARSFPAQRPVYLVLKLVQGLHRVPARRPVEGNQRGLGFARISLHRERQRRIGIPRRLCFMHADVRRH